MSVDSQDVLGNAVKKHFFDGAAESLKVHTSYNTIEEMAMEVLFREPDSFPDIEKYALSLAVGRVLDIGAGVGSHSLALQQNGLSVKALEMSAGAVEVMKARGIEEVVCQNIFDFEETGYDTFVLLMNGIGLAGDLDGLQRLLELLRRASARNAQVLFDSTDISYLHNEQDVTPPDGYFGEVQFQFQYGGTLGPSFKWLYIDSSTMKDVAASCGWQLQVVYEDDLDHYLGRLTLMSF